MINEGSKTPRYVVSIHWHCYPVKQCTVSVMCGCVLGIKDIIPRWRPKPTPFTYFLIFLFQR